MLPPLSFEPKILHIQQISQVTQPVESPFEKMLSKRLAEIDRSLPFQARMTRILKIQRVIDKARKREVAKNPAVNRLLNGIQERLNQKQKDLF